MKETETSREKRKIEGKIGEGNGQQEKRRNPRFFEDSTFPRIGTNLKHSRRFYARKPLQLDGYAQVRNDWKLVDFVPFRVIVVVAKVEKVLAVISV